MIFKYKCIPFEVNGSKIKVCFTVIYDGVFPAENVFQKREKKIDSSKHYSKKFIQNTHFF